MNAPWRIFCVLTFKSKTEVEHFKKHPQNINLTLRWRSEERERERQRWREKRKTKSDFFSCDSLVEIEKNKQVDGSNKNSKESKSKWENGFHKLKVRCFDAMGWIRHTLVMENGFTNTCKCMYVCLVGYFFLVLYLLYVGWLCRSKYIARTLSHTHFSEIEAKWAKYLWEKCVNQMKVKGERIQY